MKTRIVVGVVLFSVLVAALWFGGLAMLILLALFALIAVYEMGVAFQSRGNKPILAPAYLRRRSGLYSTISISFRL